MGTEAARFEVVAGKALGMSIVVDDELVIGRHAEGAGRLADDQEISRTHARVMMDATGFLSIEDLGSTNGTFVNGLRVTAPQTLSEGDTIEMGSTTLVVREVPELNPMTARSPRTDSGPQIQDTAPPLEPAPASGQDEGRTPSSSSLLEAQAPPSFEDQTPPSFEDESPPSLEDEPTARLRDEPLVSPGGGELTGEAPVLPPPLSLRIEVDFAAREARLRLDDASEPVRLVFESGAWRASPSQPD
jgi:predicted component of type VI protein secretion system